MSAGDSDEGGHSQLKTNQARVSAVLLALIGAAIVGIQTYVYVNFGDYYIDGDSSSQWSVLYNAVALTCGSVSFVAGALCLCCVAARRPSSALGFGLFLNILTAIVAIASTVVSSMESVRIDSSAEHPCNMMSLDICSLWFGLEIAVAALSGVGFGISLVMIIVISIGLCGGRGSKTTQQQPSPVIIIEEIVIPPEVEPAVDLPVIKDEEPIQVEEEIPYVEQLKMLSREEIERRLEQHFQNQFLEELRQELDRRNLIQKEEDEPVNVNEESVAYSPEASKPDYVL